MSNTTALSTATIPDRDIALLNKATEIMKLFQTAISLGYSITFLPHQLQVFVEICESGVLVKPDEARAEGE